MEKTKKEKFKLKITLQTWLLVAILIIGISNLIVSIENGEDHEDRFEHYCGNESIHDIDDFEGHDDDKWFEFDFFTGEENYEDNENEVIN